MKKKITVTAIVLALGAMVALALWARRTPQSQPQPTAAATAAPTIATAAPTLPPPTQPDWQLGIVRAGPAEAISTHFQKGDTLEIVGAFQDYYVVCGSDGNLLVEKRFLRSADEAPFECWTGYAHSGTTVYASVFLTGDVVADLAPNQAVTVEEGKEDWLFITWDAGEGYVSKAQLGTAPVYPHSGSSGSGSAGSAPDSGSGAPAQDGTDVDVGSLCAEGGYGSIVLLSCYDGAQVESCPEAGPALVIADQIPGYALLLSRGDAVKVTEYDDQQVTIWLDEGRSATLPRFLLRLSEDEAPTSQTFYSASGASVYSDYHLNETALDALPVNTPVEVLETISEFCVVSIDSEIFYMSPNQLSATPYIIGSSGASASGNSGASGNTGTTDTSDADVWTPPAM